MKKALKQITIRLESKRAKKFEEAWGIEPLGAIVERAVNAINMSGINARWIAEMALRAVSAAIIERGNIPFPLRVQLDFDEKMLAKKKIAGVSPKGHEFVATSAAIPLPKCEVQKPARERQYSWETLDDVVVPDVFPKLAAYYHQEPARLASMLLIDFCQHPPKDLIIVKRNDEPSDESPDGNRRG